MHLFIRTFPVMLVYFSVQASKHPFPLKTRDGIWRGDGGLLWDVRFELSFTAPRWEKENQDKGRNWREMKADSISGGFWVFPQR